MLIVHIGFNLIPGKEEEFLQLHYRHVESQKQALGNLGGYLLKSIETPNKYVGLQFWESRADREVYTDSGALIHLPSYNVFVIEQTKREFYDVMAEVVGSSVPKWVRHGEFDVNLRLRREFERRLTENTVKEAEKFKERGLASSRLLRYLGNDSKYLYLGMWRSQEDSDAFVRDPERSARRPFEDMLIVPGIAGSYEVVAGFQAGDV